jgi:hypothetical protein
MKSMKITHPACEELIVNGVVMLFGERSPAADNHILVTLLGKKLDSRKLMDLRA